MFICPGGKGYQTEFTLTSVVWSATAQGASSSLGFGSFTPTNPPFNTTYIKDLYEVKDTTPGEESHYFQLTFNAAPAADPWSVSVIVDGVLYAFTGGAGVSSTYNLPFGDGFVLTVGDHTVQVY